jgi:hypothetical protein
MRIAGAPIGRPQDSLKKPHPEDPELRIIA